MKVGVLGLQGDVREHARALEGAGATPVVVKRAEDLSLVDGLVVPGGESTTIGKLLVRFGLMQPLRERAGRGMPLFGTCAGLILMARDVLGPDRAPDRLGLMDVAVRRNAYGRQIDSFETRIRLQDYDDPLEVAFIRAPVIERLGADVEVLATHDGSPVLVRQGTLLGSTFHAEVTGDDRVHEMFVRMAHAGRGVGAGAAQGRVVHGHGATGAS